MRYQDRTLATLPPQAVSLLTYLLINRDRAQTRDLLAGKFWSELPEDRARKRLSNSLWQIKTAAIESGIPELLQPSSAEIRATTAHPIEVDSEEFERELGDYERELRSRLVQGVLADRLADVLSSYPGDFLAGHYADWIEFERDRIRDRYHDALHQLVRLYKARSQYDVALRFASTLVKQEPLREDLHREVMRLQALLGQASAAERQFDTCRRELLAELGMEPSAETIELIERIRTDAPRVANEPDATDAAKPSALIGRSHEISVLMRRAEELIGGEGGVVLIEGYPGIGKSRLVEEFVDGVDWRGARVLSGGNTELSPMRPYDTLRQVLGPVVTGLRGEHLAEVIEPVWLQQAAEVFPDLERYLDGAEPTRALRPDEEPTRMSEALVRVILAQGELAPTVIVLEDIHWADDDSMQVLVQLGSRLARSGVLLCLTYRRFEAEQSASVWKGILELEALASGTRMVLAPLSASEVRELINVQVGPGGLTRAAMSQVIEHTNGNPLYILETLRNPRALFDLDTSVGSFGSLDLPHTVAKSLELRLGSFDVAVRRVLEGLAALAEPATTKTVADIAGLDRKGAIVALTEAVDSGFVVADDNGVCRFAHDQTRRVVYELVSEGERRAIHDRIFVSLEASVDPEPEKLAYHARLAERLADGHRWHLLAALQALDVNGYRVAADHYGQADEAAQDLGLSLVERARDLLAYEAALDVLGRREDQTIVLKMLNEVELPIEQQLELAEREALLLLNTDKPDEAARLALGAVERAKQAGLPYHGLLNAVGFARYLAGKYRAAIEPLRQSMADSPDVANRLAPETTLGKALIDMLDFEAGVEHLNRAVADAEQIDDPRAKVEAVSYQAVALSLSGRQLEAESKLLHAVELSRAIGYRRGEGVNLVNLATNYVRRGRGGQALDLFAEASDVFGSLSNARGEAFVKLNSASLSHRLLGDDDVARELATSSAVFFRTVEDRPHEAWALSLLSSIDLRQGRRRLARRRLHDLLVRAMHDEDVATEVEIRRGISNVEMTLGNYGLVVEHLDRVLALSESFPLDTMVANVLACRAMACCLLGDRAEAESYAARAAAANQAGSDMAHVTAWSCARVLESAGRVKESAGQVELAYRFVAESLVGLDHDVAARSWVAVPEHACIAESYERHFARTVEVQLPAASAPTGRPLTEDDFVDVVWAVSRPDDWKTNEPGERRIARIGRLAQEAVDQGALARIVDLAQTLAVSERTIKRDLAEMRRRGWQPRTRKSAH